MRILSLVSLMVVIISCNTTDSTKKESIVQKDLIDDYQNNEIDSFINDISVFNDSVINHKFKDINNYINQWDTMPPDVFFRNKEGSEYLRLIKWPGDGQYSFKEVEIGYVIDLKQDVEFYQLDFDVFSTGKKVELSFSKDEVMMKWDVQWIKSLNQELDILTYTNPKELYEANCYFKNDSLIKIRFGYIYSVRAKFCEDNVGRLLRSSKYIRYK